MDESRYKYTFEECIDHVESLKRKYDLPDDFVPRLDDFVTAARDGEYTREEAAERVGKLIGWLYGNHEEYEYFDQIRRYLNSVMTSLYGND